MRLSEYTDYACRVLMHCTAHPDRLTTIGELAELYGISKNHLMKIVQDLGRHGWLQTTRGRGGGIRLGVDPGQLRLGDIVRMAETDLRLVECFDAGTNRCRLSPGCRLQQVLNKALRAYFAELDAVTLADLAGLGSGFDILLSRLALLAPLSAKRARAATPVFADQRVGSLKARKPQAKTA